MTTALPTKVVQEDARLEGAADKSREALTRHRWHWTLDESNPDRVSVSEYARSIGRAKTTILDMVNGYVSWAGRGAPSGELANDLERAKLSGDRLAATEAVAKATGVSVGAARRHKADEIREVRATAQERAERNRTTVAEEAEHVAQQRVRFAKAQKASDDDRKSHSTLRYIEVEGKLAAAKRYLTEALRVTEGVDFDAEETELITDSLANIRALLGLIDMRIAGNTNVDWDGELAKLGGAS